MVETQVTELPKSEKTVGIIGGLGPDATVDFFAKLLAASDAKSDQDHLHIIIENNPKVPNRHAAIKGSGPSAAPALVNMATTLEVAGADFVVMACNTAHAFQNDITAALKIPFISMIDEVVDELTRHHPSASRIGLMAADGCLAAGLYQQQLSNKGFIPVTWNDAEVKDFMTTVYRIKAGERGSDIRHNLTDLANSLIDDGAEIIIAACTEVPLILSSDDFPLPLISSTDLLAQRCVIYARGLEPLPTHLD